MIELTDQTGHLVKLKNNPKRIISLVPSQTELLADLGLKNEILGVTKFCVHPRELKLDKEIIGGTKNVKIEKIKELNPDLIIANKEENTESDIKELRKHFNVYTSDIIEIKDALEMILAIGKMCDKRVESMMLVNRIEQSFLDIHSKSNLNVAYVIWQNPIMLAGQDTFINQMLAISGLKNVIEEPSSRYPEISFEELKKLNPDIVFLSSEPFPFKEKHIEAFSKKLECKVILVDGEMYSWYGSRLIKFTAYSNNLKF